MSKEMKDQFDRIFELRKVAGEEPPRKVSYFKPRDKVQREEVRKLGVLREELLTGRAVRVKLHSNEDSAADATDSTLKILPMGGDAHLKRNAVGKVEFDREGYATVITSNPRFVAFALRNQGYVLEVNYNDN